MDISSEQTEIFCKQTKKVIHVAWAYDIIRIHKYMLFTGPSASGRTQDLGRSFFPYGPT